MKKARKSKSVTGLVTVTTSDTPADNEGPRMINPEPEDKLIMDTTSEDEDGSDSDVESTTGHRVSRSMAIIYMLKQEGFITVNEDAPKKDKYLDIVKTVLPKIPTSEYPDEEDSDISDLSGSIDFDFINPDNDGANTKAGEFMIDKNNGLSETSKIYKVRKPDYDKDIIVETSDDVEAKVAKLDLSDNNTNDPSEVQVNKETENVTISVCALEDTVNDEMRHKLGENTHQKEVTNISNIAADLEEKDTEDNSKQDFKAIKDGGNKEESENVDSKSNTLQQSNKETKSFRYILKKLSKDNRISQDSVYYEALKTYVKCLDEHYRDNEAVELFDTPTDELEEFARCLNSYSPLDYISITETYNTPLPDQTDLEYWYADWGRDQSGPMERALNVLKKRAASKRLTCALMFKDICLKTHHAPFDIRYRYTNRKYAVIIFACVLVSLDEDWKMPIGYVYASPMSAKDQAEMINLCLIDCHEAGVDAVAVTLETPTPAEFLGCSFKDPKNLKTTFKHPQCDREVAVWIDPCLALRSVRDLLNVKGTLEDGAGNTVRWSLIEKLKHLYSHDNTEGYSKAEFLELRNHIVKVGLTTELFSESLARALELCGQVKPLVFNDTDPTQKYIKIINMIYDILHSTKVKNWSDVEQQLNEATEYIMGIYCNEVNKLVVDDEQNLNEDERFVHTSFVAGKQACGFVILLTCVNSLKHLFTTLIEKEQRIDCLNTHRLCKDHVEDFVKNLRAYKLIDIKKFNGFIFENFCDRWFDDLEKNPRFFDQNMTLEQWPFKNKYTPAVTLNRTCGKRSYDEICSYQYVVKKLPKGSCHEEAIKVLGHFTNAMDSEMDVADRKYMVGYLAGWIAAKFSKYLKCEVCVDALCTDKKLWFHKFITLKAYGVCLPSEEVFRICWECERALRQKLSVAELQIWVLCCLEHKFPWSSHQAKHHRTHFIHLARAVIAKYMQLRVAVPFSTKDKKEILATFRYFAGLLKRNRVEK